MAESNYVTALPPGTIAATVRDATHRGAATGMPTPDLAFTDDAVTTLTYRYLDGRTVAANTVTAWKAAVADPALPADAPWRVRETVEQQLGQAMAAMQQIVDTADLPAGTLTGAQLSNAARARQVEMKTVARLLRRLVRQVRGDWTGSD